jgi:DNA-binding CsgD family transcriptional regulator
MSEAHWAAGAGAVVEALGTPGLPKALAETLREVAPFTYTVMFGYRGADRPVDLYDDFPLAKRKVFVTDYQAGPYLLDPFYLAAVGRVAPGLYRLKDMAPDRFYQGEYFRNYYVQTGLAEEIAYFVDLPDGTTLVLSLMRAEQVFSQRAFQALQALCPFVAAVARRHWASAARTEAVPDQQPTVPRLGREAHDFSGFGDGLLTLREREVAEFTLKGHSAESTGQVLGIAPGTVRIHRRNLYAKLRINSQGELFLRFLDTLVR